MALLCLRDRSTVAAVLLRSFSSVRTCGCESLRITEEAERLRQLVILKLRKSRRRMSAVSDRNGRALERRMRSSQTGKAHMEHADVKKGMERLAVHVDRAKKVAAQSRPNLSAARLGRYGTGSAVQCSAVQCSAVQCSAVQCAYSSRRGTVCRQSSR